MVYPIVGFTKIGPGITCNRKTRLERLARGKHSSSIRIFVNSGRKKFMALTPEVDTFRGHPLDRQLALGGLVVRVVFNPPEI
jgi:hypothetical protein